MGGETRGQKVELNALKRLGAPETRKKIIGVRVRSGTIKEERVQYA